MDYIIEDINSTGTRPGLVLQRQTIERTKTKAKAQAA